MGITLSGYLILRVGARVNHQTCPVTCTYAIRRMRTREDEQNRGRNGDEELLLARILRGSH